MLKTIRFEKGLAKTAVENLIETINDGISINIVMLGIEKTKDKKYLKNRVLLEAYRLLEKKLPETNL